MHFITGEETAEMEGRFGEMMVNEPMTHLTNHVHVVIDAGDDEVGDFYPHAGIVHSEDGVEDWLEMTVTNALVDGVAE